MSSKKKGPTRKGAGKKPPEGEEPIRGAEEPGADDRFEELRQTGEAVGKLAANEAAFTGTVEAFRAENAEQFQSELGKLGLVRFCILICRWLCSKHCVFICSKLCKQPPAVTEQLPIAELREFANVTARLASDGALLKRFVEALNREVVGAFNGLLAESKWERFCHQLCHFLCSVRCRRVCRRLCPPLPLITEVGYIPTNKIDGQGRGSGPSLPPG